MQKIESIVSKLKWTVSRECKLGIFSFLKINMYKDIKDNAAKISQNNEIRALLGGIMGFATDDVRIRDSFQIATDNGIEYSFIPNNVETDVHPNTVDILMVNEEGQEMTIRGESLGGGKARLCRINGVEVDFTGEYSSIVVVQKDAPGVVAYITKCLSELGINIAFMRLFRESKGNTAYTIVESDDLVPEDIADTIRRNKNVYNVMVVQM